MQILPGIEIIMGSGSECNIYVIDGELLIDAGSGNNFVKAKEEIEKLGKKQIKTIVNTHCHFDHVGGNRKFRDWLKAEIAVHKDDKESVEKGHNTMFEMFTDNYRITTVDRVLEHMGIIKTKNFFFEVIHTPGHTPGSICLYDKKSRVMITGDTLFESGIGRTDFPGGSKNQLQESLKKLQKYEIAYLLPGHGPIKIGGVNFLVRQMINILKEDEFL